MDNTPTAVDNTVQQAKAQSPEVPPEMLDAFLEWKRQKDAELAQAKQAASQAKRAAQKRKKAKRKQAQNSRRRNRR